LLNFVQVNWIITRNDEFAPIDLSSPAQQSLSQALCFLAYQRWSAAFLPRAQLSCSQPGRACYPGGAPSPPRYRIDGQATMCSSRGTRGRDGRTDQLATWPAIPSRHEVGEDGAGSGAEAAVTQRHGRVTGGSRGGPPRAGPGRRQEGRV